jgi:hypothetical protein
MNNSSQEEPCTITLNNDTIDLTPYTCGISSDTWTGLTTTSIPALTSSDIITLTSSGITNNSYSIGSLSIGNIETIDVSGLVGSWSISEFDGRFPDYTRVMDMCKQYPGLEIAYRKFKEVYKMVKEDYDGKEREKRGRK